MREHLRVEGLDVDAHRVDAHVADLVEHAQIGRWLELHLDRQPEASLTAWPQRAT
jgi:hypothetical protein